MTCRTVGIRVVAVSRARSKAGLVLMKDDWGPVSILPRQGEVAGTCQSEGESDYRCSVSSPSVTCGDTSPRRGKTESSAHQVWAASFLRHAPSCRARSGIHGSAHSIELGLRNGSPRNQSVLNSRQNVTVIPAQAGTHTGKPRAIDISVWGAPVLKITPSPRTRSGVHRSANSNLSILRNRGCRNGSGMTENR